ncbi:pneumococcal histidine triad protein B [Streptococcus pneumoniae]|nr:pneumococcal histidine triad protein B [Streptococcus pneumoniae]
MKINKKYLAGSVAVLALSVCSYELGRHQAGQVKKESNRVAYIDGDQAGQKAENLTPDEVSKREGINAEQIVIKITDQGYVTSHGDHYHYYNGKVPYDAIISEELLMKDPNYQLKDSDIVNEIKGGYVVLALAASGGNGAWQGAIYTLIYTLGMALPFLVLALASGLVMPYFSKIKRHMMLLKKIGGFLIVLMGILLLLGQVNVLAGIFE